MSNFDTILRRHIGVIGRWQIRLFCLIVVAHANPFLNFHQLALLSNPGLCRQPTLEALNWTQKDIARFTRPPTASYANCIEVDFDSVKSLLTDNTTVEEAESLMGFNRNSTRPCRHGWTDLQGADTVFRYSLTTAFELSCDRVVLIPAMNALSMLGSLLGQISSGLLADKFGRKKVGIICGVAAVLLININVLCPNLWSYMLVRFITTGFTNATYIIFTVYWSEITDGNHRSLFMAARGFYSSVLSNGLLALSAFLLQDWRFVLLVINLPNMLVFALPWMIPESPRWLLSQGRISEARRVMEAAVRENKGEEHVVELRAKWSHLQAEATPPEAFRSALGALLKNPRMRRALLTMLLVFSGMSVAFFCLPFYSVRLPLNPYLLSYVTALSSIPGFGIQMLCYRFFHRKRPLLVVFFFLSTSCLAAALCLRLNSAHGDLGAVVLVTIANSTTHAINGMLLIFTAEIFPTNARNSVLGLMMGLSKVGAALGMFVERLDDFFGRAVPLMAFSAVCAAATGAAALLPDTRGTSMAELSISADVEQEKEEDSQTFL